MLKIVGTFLVKFTNYYKIHYHVLEDYLSDLDTNKYRVYESQEDLRNNFDIIQTIKWKLAEDDRKFYLAYYKSLVLLYRDEKNLCKVKVTMLDVLKSQMKEASVFGFHKSLPDLPDECLKSKATTLDFCKPVDDLDIPEERKNWLLQKTAERDITSAYDDAREAFEDKEKMGKLTEDVIEKTSDHLRQVKQSQNPACAGLLSISIKYLDGCLRRRQ
ncbi:hypothetical protein MKW94_030813 [Papaver nudicaule]|uniref:Uncharacterized protein n=1 Tax=Papaver nudicaule TaxID=74823 RepID=A0AA41V9X4_PAPNU|nr:hypothetical protein [Papaver nudicaule]